MRRTLGLLSIVCFLAAPAMATPGIEVVVGDPNASIDEAALIRLEPNTPGQAVPIYIRPPSGQSAALIDIANVAVSLYIDYPTLPETPGMTPYVESLDLEDPNAIFYPYPQSADVDGGPHRGSDQLWCFEQRNMSVTNDVDADGLLGVIYIDTTGFGLGAQPDVFELVTNNEGVVSAGGFAMVPTAFYNYVPQQGEIQVDAEFGQAFIIIPEPVTLGLLAAGGFGLLLRRRRR